MRPVIIIQIVQNPLVYIGMFASLLIAQTFHLSRIDRLDNAREIFARVPHKMLLFDQLAQVQKLLQLVDLNARLFDQLLAVYEQYLLERKVLEPVLNVLVVQAIANYSPVGFYAVIFIVQHLLEPFRLVRRIRSVARRFNIPPLPPLALNVLGHGSNYGIPQDHDELRFGAHFVDSLGRFGVY